MQVFESNKTNSHFPKHCIIQFFFSLSFIFVVTRSVTLVPNSLNASYLVRKGSNNTVTQLALQVRRQSISKAISTQFSIFSFLSLQPNTPLAAHHGDILVRDRLNRFASPRPLKSRLSLTQNKNILPVVVGRTDSVSRSHRVRV
jgi:hypothetical protein